MYNRFIIYFQIRIGQQPDPFNKENVNSATVSPASGFNAMFSEFLLQLVVVLVSDDV